MPTSPRSPHLQIHSRLTRAPRYIEAGMKTKPPGQQITKTDAACRPRLGVIKVVYGCRRPTRPQKSHHAPAVVKVPTDLPLRHQDVLVLVAHGGNPSHFNIG